MTGELHILMLEDSPFDAELIQYRLKKELPESHFKVVTNKETYLEALGDFSPDIILSDNSLPDINASEALTMGRNAFPHIPFIMVSGTVQEEFATTMMKAGADDYILKDRLARLSLAISTAIESHEREKEKQEALDQLKQNEERYRTLVERVTDAFISLDKDFNYTYLNKQAAELIHRDAASLIGKNVWEEFPDAVGSSTYQSFTAAMKEQKYMSNIDYYAPLDLWQENHIYPSPDGLSIFVRNITAQKKAQEAVQQMEHAIMEQKVQEQKKITRTIIRAQENERNRIGQELHDNINQILVASKMFLGRGQGELAEHTKYPIELIDKAIEEIRLLTSRYVTPLKNVNLEELLNSLLNKLSENSGIVTQLTYQMEDIDPEDDLKLNIYRIIQEQVNNIIKYASAQHVQVSVKMNDEIKLLIADDGVGFDTSIRSKGIGFSNMYNRIETFNGTIDIDSSPGNGCRIKIVIPYK